MQQNDIIHNDLYNRNIIFDLKKKTNNYRFWFNFIIKKLYKNINSKTIDIDIKYINKFFLIIKKSLFDYNTEKILFLLLLIIKILILLIKF